MHNEHAYRLSKKFKDVWYPQGPIPLEVRKRVGLDTIRSHLAALGQRKAAVLLHGLTPDGALRAWLITSQGEICAEPAKLDGLDWRKWQGAWAKRVVRDVRHPRVAIPLGDSFSNGEHGQSSLSDTTLDYLSTILLPTEVKRALDSEAIDTLIVVPITVREVDPRIELVDQQAAHSGKEPSYLSSQSDLVALAIGTVPFAALPIGSGLELIDKMSVVISPDFSLFAEKAPSVRKEYVNAMVLGNPEVHGVQPLPGAEDEAKRIAELMHTDAVLLKQNATRNAVEGFVRKHAKTVDFIHLATHGMADAKNPVDESYLMFSDGRWNAREISRLRRTVSDRVTAHQIEVDLPLLEAKPLVVMSACQTALGKDFPAGTIGLARAWHWAGASNVVMSLWSVDDDATNELMQTFVGLLVEGQPVDKALRAAMLSLRSRYMNPAYWASFGVYGGVERVDEPPNRPELRIQRGHFSQITSLAVSSNGHYLASGGRDGQACLWNIEARQLLHCFPHPDPVIEVDLSRDGYLMTVSPHIGINNEPSLRFWSLASLRPVDLSGALAEMSDSIKAAAISPNARTILVNRAFGVALFSLDTQDLIANFEDKSTNLGVAEGGIRLAAFPISLAFSGDGRYAAGGGGWGTSPHSANKNGVIWVWDVTTGKNIEYFLAHDALITSVAFSNDKDSKYLVTSSIDGTVGVWEWRTHSRISTFRHEEYTLGLDKSQEFLPIATVSVSKVGPLIVTGSWGHSSLVQIWNIQTDQPIASFAGLNTTLDLENKVRAVLFSPDGKYVFSAASLRDLDSDQVVMSEALSGTEYKRFAGVAEEVSSVHFSRDSQMLVIGGETSHLWDLKQGKEVFRTVGGSNWSKAAVRLPDNKHLLEASPKDVTLWDIEGKIEEWQWQNPTESELVSSVAFCQGPKGRVVAAGGLHMHPHLWFLDQGDQEYRVFPGSIRAKRGWGSHVALSNDCNTLVGGYFQWKTDESTKTYIDKGGDIKVVDIIADHEIGPLPELSREGVRAIAVSDDGRSVTAGLWGGKIQTWNLNSPGKLLSTDPGRGLVVSAFTDSGEYALASSNRYENDDRVGHILLSLGQEAAPRRREISEGRLPFDASAAISLDGRIVAAAVNKATILWDVNSDKEIARLSSFRDGTWLVVAPDGRFDTNNLENITGVHWVMPDDPLTPLSLEIFMRDYYEPRLLPRMLAGEKFEDLPRLDRLNRAQPKVEIKPVGVVNEQEGLVDVTVEVGSQTYEVKRDGKPFVMHSGAYDLRLFRSGQLVAQLPEPQAGAAPGEQTREQELAHWRQSHQIQLDSKTGKRTITFRGIRLPRTTGLKQVEFSAYAFNIDRVKSDTARTLLDLPKGLVRRQGRAYIVTIGVDGFQGNALSRLSYAANDAKTLSAELGRRLKMVKDPKTGELHFGKTNVVPVTLITEFGTGVQADQLTTNQATKARIKAVIDKLAGHPVVSDRLAGIPNANQLQPARPEDLVLIAFSTHGDTDRRGQFYLMPYDLGTSAEVSDLRQHAISSEELSFWLRTLDAGEAVMIVDACHSAASVESKEFKPGPMGSRGLGQLAFDKGMRILAASQRDQSALETEKTKQGLLTYALVQEGLQQTPRPAADFKPKDGQIQLSEWLNYGAERVPGLYQDYREGKLKARAAFPLDKPEGKRFISIQQPALFDFARGRDALLSTVGGR